MGRRSKKNRVFKPRTNAKPTTGVREFVDVIYIERERDPETGDINVYGVCTCDKWRTSKDATTFIKIGLEAKEHVLETGHQLRLHSEE